MLQAITITAAPMHSATTVPIASSCAFAPVATDSYSAVDPLSPIRFGPNPQTLARNFSLAPISNDDATSAGGSVPPSGASGSGGSGDPKRKVSAKEVYDALVSIRDRTSVFLNEPGLADVMLEYGVIEFVTSEGRDAMKATSDELSDFVQLLARIEKTIADRKEELAAIGSEIDSWVGAILYEVGSIFSKRVKDSLRAKRKQQVDIKGEIVSLVKSKRGVEPKVKRKQILEDALDRMAYSYLQADNAWSFITDKGMGLLKVMERDKKLEYLTFEDYMKLIEG